MRVPHHYGQVVRKDLRHPHAREIPAHPKMSRAEDLLVPMHGSYSSMPHNHTQEADMDPTPFFGLMERKRREAEQETGEQEKTERTKQHPKRSQRKMTTSEEDHDAEVEQPD